MRGTSMKRDQTRRATRLFRLIRAAALFLAAGAAVETRADVLRWKLKPGETLKYTMDQKTVTTMKIAGQEVKTTLSQTINMRWSVDSATPDGGAKLTQVIDRFRTKIDSPTLPFAFDSDDEKDPEGPIAAAMVPLLRAMIGAKFSMTLAPNGDFTAVRIPESVVGALKNSGPGGAMFSEDGLKSMLGQSSLSFPDDSLEPGRSWSRRAKIPTPPVGTMSLEKTYTYRGKSPKDPKLVVIDLATNVAVEPSADSGASIKITSQKGDGSFLFRPETGRMEKSAVKGLMVMSISAMGQTLEQTTESDTVMTLDP